jgi:methionyl-tRNA formyltransferase
VILFGSRSSIAVTGFRILREWGVSVPLVVTGDEDPMTDDWRLSLAKAARDEGYECGNNLLVVHNPHQPDILERIRAAGADMILSLQWRRILRPPLLGMPRLGVVNLHNAPLPLLRGCDPFSWAIHDGLERMGVTLHQVIDEGVDSGPVLAQRLWPITASSTAWSLFQESLKEAELLMRESLEDIIDGRLVAQPQNARHASYHPGGQFRFHDLAADWGVPAVTLSAALRSRIFVPFQVPHFPFRGGRVGILGCLAVGGRARPSEVASIKPLRVGTKSGLLELTEVTFGGRNLTGTSFAEMAGLQSGETLS